MRRAAVLAVVACGHSSPPSSSRAPEPESECPLPTTWRIDDITRSAISRGWPMTTQVLAVRVLAWQQTIDDRPLRIDSALVWIKTSDPLYTISHVYRHPDDKDGWHQAMVYDMPGFEGEIQSAKPPTHAELEDFLHATDWPFAPEQDFKLVASGICAKAWQDSFNEPPWHQYH
jgi:hypothetical protein